MKTCKISTLLQFNVECEGFYKLYLFSNLLDDYCWNEERNMFIICNPTLPLYQVTLCYSNQFIFNAARSFSRPNMSVQINQTFQSKSAKHVSPIQPNMSAQINQTCQPKSTKHVSPNQPNMSSQINQTCQLNQPNMSAQINQTFFLHKKTL